METKKMNRTFTLLVAVILLAGSAYFIHKNFMNKSNIVNTKNPPVKSKGKGEGESVSPKGSALYRISDETIVYPIEGLIGTVKGDTLELNFITQEDRIIAVHTKVGDFVRPGQVLMEMDHTRTLAKKQQAQTALDRTQQMQAVGAATVNDVRDAESVYQFALKDYEDTFLRAPKGGIISSLNKKVGESISRNEPALSLVSTQGRLFIETQVIENQIEDIRTGGKGYVSISAIAQASIPVTISGVSHEVTVTGRTGVVQLNLPGNVLNRVRPGMSAQCMIYAAPHVGKLIPKTAYYSETKSVILAEATHEKDSYQFTERGVVIGREIEGLFFEVFSGLLPNDLIVLNRSGVQVVANSPVVISDEPLNSLSYKKKRNDK